MVRQIRTNAQCRLDTGEEIARFWEKIVLDANMDCWVWEGSRNQGDYGLLRLRDVGVLAHRVAYVTYRGSIPEGMQLDHLCRNRRCVNPWHLEPVTQRVNLMRGEGPAAKMARKTHCLNGHELVAPNIYDGEWATSRGWRICKVCRQKAQKQYHDRKRDG